MQGGKKRREPVACELRRLVGQAKALHARKAPERTRHFRIHGLDAVELGSGHCFFSRTSSRGADHGYGLISMSAGSATRGPMPLGQMYS
jgi:hypothetical protein